MPQHGMLCSTTTRSCFSPTRPDQFDYPDVGYGAMSAEEVHKATLCILAFSTAHVMTVDELKTQIERGTTAVRAKRKKAA